MRMSAIKPERKWLGWSVQSGVERSKIRVGPVAGTRNRSQLGHRMPEPRSGVAKRLYLCAERRQHRIDGVLLGECRLKRLSRPNRTRIGSRPKELDIGIGVVTLFLGFVDLDLPQAPLNCRPMTFNQVAVRQNTHLPCSPQVFRRYRNVREADFRSAITMSVLSCDLWVADTNLAAGCSNGRFYSRAAARRTEHLQRLLRCERMQQ